jgi:hypothetical protein
MIVQKIRYLMGDVLGGLKLLEYRLPLTKHGPPDIPEWPVYLIQQPFRASLLSNTSTAFAAVGSLLTGRTSRAVAGVGLGVAALAVANVGITESNTGYEEDSGADGQHFIFHVVIVLLFNRKITI